MEKEEVAALLDEFATAKPADLKQTWYETTIQLPGVREPLVDRYYLWPKQIEFIEVKKRYKAFGGARGGAKTNTLCRDLVNFMLRWPGAPVLVCRKDLKDLKGSFEEEWRKVCPPQLYDRRYGGQYHKSERWYRFPNGSTVWFGELKDWESYKSRTLARIYIEEANEVDEQAVINLDPTLRWTTGEGKCELPECLELIDAREHFKHPRYQIVMATNPSPGWIKTRFWEPWKAEQDGKGTQRPNHAFVLSTAFDNPSLPPDFIETLLEHNTITWVRNFIYGDWSSFENMVWPTFSRTIHGWRADVPWAEVVDVVGGVDYGATGAEAHRTCAYLLAKLKGGRLLTFWEYSKRGAAADDFFATLQTATKQYRVRRWAADASQNRANEALRKLGLPVYDAPRYQGAVKDGNNLVHRMLGTDNAAAEPRLYVVERDCPRLLSGIETYEMNPVTGDPVANQEDDEVNAWRYAVMEALKDRAGHGDSWDPAITKPAGAAAAKPVSKHLKAWRQSRSDRIAAWIAAAEAEEAEANPYPVRSHR